MESSDIGSEEMCYLEVDDITCGSISYNEKSRVLKFTCTYCSESYLHMEHFCNHLTDHINSVEEDPIEYTEVEDETLYQHNKCGNEQEEESCASLDSNGCVINRLYEEYDGSLYSHDEENNLPTENAGFMDETDSIIEEVEESSDLTYQLDQRFKNTNDFRGFLPQSSNITSGDVPNHAKTTAKSFTSTNNSFEECFLKETDIEKIRSQGIVVNENKEPARRSKAKNDDLMRFSTKKNKKVTTVKVIAVKNRIAEIYDRIKNEQAKTQQMYAPSGQSEQKTQHMLPTSPKGDHHGTQYGALDTKENDSTRKIIGETLITLIPEGGKIPTTLPTQLERIHNKITISSPEREASEDEASSTLSSDDKTAVCPACGKVFRSHFSLTIHKRIHYLESDSTVKLAHKCSDCDQLFNKLSQLKQHVESVHYPDGFVCKICNRRLCSLSLLERHMVKVHLERPFNCQLCGKNFSDPITYEEHVISHKSADKCHKCQICGRKYSTQFFLKQHMRNHKKQMPQTCVVCGKVTLRITQHMKIHTPRPKRLLSCSVCGKIFNFSSGLSHHFKVMHKLPRPPPKQKKDNNANTQRRKRKSRNNENVHKIKDDSYHHMASRENLNDSQIIIEEPSEIPDEVYTADEFITQSPVQNPSLSDKDSGVHMSDRNNSSHNFDEEDVNHKEEEAKRVIVELIQNSIYPSFLSENLLTPPIAREETISAVNSIVRDS
ncbi:zinc finger protein ZFP2 [Stomoxys calcitrans]|uniref:zinc finger protein ZFP2 n=1 Tax=Stomoxys calcitrans TaxID=35570 RepID=UPI0027E223CB|nr:zinc finger protein ZFP2 [Stomoxys calcitrans]